MLSYEDIILLGEERVLVIQEHKDGRPLPVRPELALTAPAEAAAKRKPPEAQRDASSCRVR
jgi:hypothetical protein